MPALEKLIKISKDRSYDVYERFLWPERVSEDALWCDENLLTTYGTPLHDRLDERQRIALSKWEAINFFSLNVHGIKDAIAFVCNRFYDRRYEKYSEYLHFFLSEENAHMWFFAKFCLDYGGKIYRTLSVKTDDASSALVSDLYMFSSTLIFEEFVGFYNQKVGNNDSVPEIIREINRQHYIDESRHVQFGREVIKDIYEEIRRTDPNWEGRHAEIEKTIKRIFLHFIGLMYSPSAYADAETHKSLGFSSAPELRNVLRNAPERSAYHALWFKKTAKYFENLGAVSSSDFL